MDAENDKIMVVSHCLLNPESRLAGIKNPGKFSPGKKNVIQLPCPELIYFGSSRREITRDQLIHSAYRKFCRQLFDPFADMIEEFYRRGFSIEFVGVGKSPSCAADLTTVAGPAGRVSNFTHEHVAGRGVFFEEIEMELVRRGICYSMQDCHKQ
ncbi:putative secreted protein [Methanohalophilus euhalobius]|uniref:Predicted secreted protein n=1 Tax=Methanohalophilus euhalobius TaxID=51203 RepID=A0A285EXM6_9EURY|nr:MULTISPECIES: DUF523 domain-containing protein [Methanohalophilus]ODV50579.1 MAG: hypothetical protein A8273_120 [Methanohalophilus sp. 2-GBenrich]TCL12702.1 putative secreted protein [Methanohalophilus euhalobius]SNY03802.1 Predicted secreted protein [Methanohalophilus euhalobius]